MMSEKTQVWLIDDEQDVVDFFEEKIKSIEYIDLVVFNDVDEFLTKLLSKDRADIIFLDGNLDNSNLGSTDLVKKIREEKGDKTIVYALTNSVRIEKEMEAAGANGYFRKDDFELIEKLF